MRAPHVVVAALALAASSVAAEEPRASPPPSPDPALSSLDGRLLATPDRKLFQLGGVQLSLRPAAGDATTAEPFAPPAPAPHEDRTYFNMDARKTSLLFHLVPARAGGGVPR